MAAQQAARRDDVRRAVCGTVLFLLLTAAGLLIVKWAPYWSKAHVAAATHAIGASIVSGKSVAAQPAGIQSAYQYAIAYFKAVWEAVALALILGAAVQVLIPRRWLLRWLGGTGVRYSIVGAALALPSMMCTCCAGPITVGLRRQRASVAGALAVFLGNPTLNPAVLLFIGFVLGWRYAAIRTVFGVAAVLSISYFAQRLDGNGASAPVGFEDHPPSPIEQPGASFGTLAIAYARELWIEAYTILPGYAIIVCVLGAVRAWLFPPELTLHAAGITGILALSAIGTLFVIPTAGEIPIVQTLLAHGMSPGPAAALLVTLPAVSLPSLYIVRNVFSKRILAFVALGVFLAGTIAGIAAMSALR